MRLWEVFDDITTAELKDIETRLDRDIYQPVELVRKNKPVLDLEIPGKNSHFMQRLKQRAKKANITSFEIEDLLARAKIDSTLGYSKELNDLSKKENPNDTVVIQDPKSKLVIPVIVTPNDECSSATIDGIPVCKTSVGKKPKNKIIPKTIYRKGIND